MQVETVTAEREEYFKTLYGEITHWARTEGMTPLVSFLPQRIRNWGHHDLAIDLEKGEIWGKNNLTFGLGLGRWGDRGVHNAILKLNFGAYGSSLEDITRPRTFQQTLGPQLLADLVDRGNLMSGEFKSYAPGDLVEINCWANARIFGGDNLSGENPYSLVSVVARTIRQGR